MAKKKWKDLTDQQQAAIVAGAAIELVITTIALVDLARRPAVQVRGPKVFWVLGMVVQPSGPLAYFGLGRRTAEMAS